MDVNLSQVPQSPPKPETPARAPRRSPRPEQSPAERSGPPPAQPTGRRLTARDRRNSERQQDLERSFSVSDSDSADSESESAGYEVRQMRGLADLSSFAPEEGFDSSRPLDDPVVTAVEERRRRREFRRQLRQEQRDAESADGQADGRAVPEGTAGGGGRQSAAPGSADGEREPSEPGERLRHRAYRLLCRSCGSGYRMARGSAMQRYAPGSGCPFAGRWYR